MASMTGHDRAVGVIWSIGVIVLVASMIAGAIQVVSNFSSEMAFRWVMALFFLGGEVIHDFSFAMIWGIVVGTYSSICIAVPLLLYFGLDDQARRNLFDGDEGDAEPATDAI